MEYDHNLSLKENYMRFYQDCLSETGKSMVLRLANTLYYDLGPDDELEKQRIYLRDNGIKHCKWVLTEWDRVFLQWKSGGGSNWKFVLSDKQHNKSYLGLWSDIFKDDSDPSVIGYVFENGQYTRIIITFAHEHSDDNGNIIGPEDTTQPQPIQLSATEAPQPETQQPENTPEEPTSLPIEMCDELRQYIVAKGTAGVYNKGPKNPLYNINLARDLKDNVFIGNDPISSYDQFMSSVY